MIDIDSLMDTADDLGISYSNNYSGRGMFGATCFSITGHIGDLVRFLSALPDDVSDELLDPSTDNMGLGIVFYWPYKLRTKEGMFG